MDPLEAFSDFDAQSSITMGTGNPDSRIIWSDDPEYAYLQTLANPEDSSSRLGDSLQAMDYEQRNNSFIGGAVDSSGLYYDTDADDTVARVQPDQQTTYWFRDRRSAVTKIDDLVLISRTQPEDPSKTNVPGLILVKPEGQGTNDTESETSPKGDRNDWWHDEVPHWRNKRSIVLLRMIYFMILLLAVAIVGMSLMVAKERNKDISGLSPISTIAPTLRIASNTTLSPTISPTNPPTAFLSTPSPSLGRIATRGPTNLPTQEPSLSPTLSPTSSPTQDPRETIEEILSSSFVESSQELKNHSTPQYQALDWLSEDDYTLALLGFNGTEGNRLLLEGETHLRVTQRWVLATLFYSTGGRSASWRNSQGWLTSTDECGWEFVSSCNNNGAIVELVIEDNGLVGTLPREIGHLGEALEMLSFNSNSIGGSLPSTIGLLTGVQRLTLQNNNFVGSLPTTLGNMASLQFLALRENDVTGRLPTELGGLENLHSLDLAVTDISGSIPSQLSLCSALKSISLGSTKLSGTIPSVLGNLPLLRDFAAARTDITGSVPDGFCDGSGLRGLRMDCREVSCPCCTHCCVDGEGSCSGVTPSPTPAPTKLPSSVPTKSPTLHPTQLPTETPTMMPTTVQPTEVPSDIPVSSAPTSSPSKPESVSPTLTHFDLLTESPTVAPTWKGRTTPSPTSSLTTKAPTFSPTDAPVLLDSTLSPTKDDNTTSASD